MRAVAILFLLCSALAPLAADKLTPLTVATAGQPGFTLLPPGQTRVHFTNFLADATAEKNRVYENGSGVALGDVDGDGLCDIFFCALERPNALFRNLGNWTFEEIPNAGGAACAGQFSTGAALADLDADGDLDLLVNGIASGTRLFRNDGRGRFTEDTEAGFERGSGATSLALADIDADGDLDIFVTTYRSYTIQDGVTPGFEVAQVQGRLVAKPEEQFEIREGPSGPRLLEKGEPDILYLNDGAGKFAAASWTDGRFRDEHGRPLRAAPPHWGLAAMFRDLNGDLAPDLYICNDFLHSPDEIWINDGNGNFREIATFAIRHTSWSSMSVDVADINHDGFMDLFVADMLSPDNIRRQTQRANAELASMRVPFANPEFRPQYFQNTLQLNRGDGTFAEISQLAGLHATDWTWSAIFLDVDLDGWEDLLVTTGHNHDVQDADTATRFSFVLNAPPHLRQKTLLHYPPLRTPNRAFRNNRDLTFSEAGPVWGFDHVGISHGMACADLDGDGDLDLVINNLNETASLYRNNAPAPRLAVRLKGLAPNRAGVGAQIEVRSGSLVQRQEIIAGGRYLSSDDAARTFAAPSTSEVTVRWPRGAISKLENLAPNQLIEIAEPAIQTPASPQTSAASATWFEDVSDRLGHTHQELFFDDWGRQPLLPNRLSQLGPQAAWIDLDNDGWPDLIIGAGRGDRPAAYRNDQKGGFIAIPLADSEPALGDHDGIAAVRLNGASLAAIAISNYESPSLADPSVVVYGLDDGKFVRRLSLPGQTAAAGPVAAGDIDGDGFPELFVGSRFIPGRYPESAPSRFFRFDGARWRLDRKLSLVVAEAGLVTGAQFADLDGDNDLDLALSTDWGPIRVFKNDHGAFTEATAGLGLAKLTGRWNNLIVADFDRDGRPDLFAANWGRNTKFQPYLARPVRLAYGEFNGDNHLEIVECFFDPGLKKYVPWRGRVGLVRNIPSIAALFPTFAEFAPAATEQVLAGHSHQTLEAATLDTTLFLNRTNQFIPAPLPIEAQFAPVFAMAAADFDNDGHLDLFLAQNFFGVLDEATRFDAGRGQLLKGDGRGGFRAIPGQESGITLYGEQRACAAADFDHDGKIDLVITQNNGPTKLYRNWKAD